jgi:hypothetical protein
MAKKNTIVGTYAVQTFDFSTWCNEEQPVKMETKLKKKNKKKIVYPMFAEFAVHTSDTYWHKKFNVLANGKIPKYFTVYGDTIAYSKSGKMVEWQRTSDNAEDTKTCIEFFKNYGGLFSKRDETEFIEQSMTPSDSYVEICSEDPPIIKTWTQYDKKSQELLIKNYTQDLGDQMNLTKSERLLLLQTLRLDIADKRFNKNNIVLNNNKIVDIIGLQSDKNKVFRITESSTRNVKKVEPKVSNSSDFDYPKDMVVNYQQRFEKYYELMNKKCLKYKN